MGGESRLPGRVRMSRKRDQGRRRAREKEGKERQETERRQAENRNRDGQRTGQQAAEGGGGRGGLECSWAGLLSAQPSGHQAQQRTASGTCRARVPELASLSLWSPAQLFFALFRFAFPSLSFMVPSTVPARSLQFWNASLAPQRGAGSTGVID